MDFCWGDKTSSLQLLEHKFWTRYRNLIKFFCILLFRKGTISKYVSYLYRFCFWICETIWSITTGVFFLPEPNVLASCYPLNLIYHKGYLNQIWAMILWGRVPHFWSTLKSHTSVVSFLWAIIASGTTKLHALNWKTGAVPWPCVGFLSVRYRCKALNEWKFNSEASES